MRENRCRDYAGEVILYENATSCQERKVYPRRGARRNSLTIRQRLLQMLRESELTARDVSRLLGIREKEVYRTPPPHRTVPAQAISPDLPSCALPQLRVCFQKTPTLHHPESLPCLPVRIHQSPRLCCQRTSREVKSTAVRNTARAINGQASNTITCYYM